MISSRLVFAAAFLTLPSLAQAQSCIADDFNDFIARFSHEITVQEASTADPITVTALDFGTTEPEPVMVAQEVPLAEVTWPVMPDLTGLDTSRRRAEVTIDGDSAEVLVAGLDNGENVTWSFRRAPCWTLTAITDSSM